MKAPEYRCINIDWLEIYCLEPIETPHTPDYYREQGLLVEERDYGTRIYEQMFKINDDEGGTILEVRRQPKQAGIENAILPINACHVRLSNRTCYADNAVQILRDFCQAYQLEIVRVYRIDIALDFERFDSGDDPRSFIMRYVKRKYSKINQAEAHGHFKDRWDDRDWNSLSWGSPKSAISTKIYNKTLELKEVKDKPYIRQQWFLNRLVDDPQRLYKINTNGSIRYPVIWRLEFSIKSNVKNWLTYEKDGNSKTLRSVRNTLDMYDTKDKLLTMFALLQDHYFHFRYFKGGKAKYECPRKELFCFTANEQFYKVEHPSHASQPSTLEQRLLRYLQQYKLKHPAADTKQAVELLITTIEKDDLARLLENPYSKLQLQALQLAIQARWQGSSKDIGQLIHEYTETLSQKPKIW